MGWKALIELWLSGDTSLDRVPTMRDQGSKMLKFIAENQSNVLDICITHDVCILAIFNVLLGKGFNNEVEVPFCGGIYASHAKLLWLLSRMQSAPTLFFTGTIKSW